MPKPLGMTSTFQITQPSPAMDKIYDAVEAAIIENCTPKRFVQEVWECWQISLHEKQKEIDSDFQQILNKL